jgi:nicotinamide riboside kinase
MPRCIMISGPHAIGKSTTARALASSLEAMFMASIAGPVAQKMKYEIDKNPQPVQVIEYQYEVLKCVEFMYDATALVDTVFDRSPLDSAAYLHLALRDDPAFDKVTDEYINLCVQLTNEHCDYLVLPYADLSTPYDDKLGRPTYTPEQMNFRYDYSRVLERLVSRLDPTVNVIIVPDDKQYERRTKYILDVLKEAA